MVYTSPFPPVSISNESLPKKILRAIWKHGESYPIQHAIVSFHLEIAKLSSCLDVLLQEDLNQLITVLNTQEFL